MLQKAIKDLGINPEKPNPANTSSRRWNNGEKVKVTEFKLPELGENIDQGDLVRLMISPGTTITQGQAVMELETDKAVVEVPSTVSGVVKEIRVKEGEKIKVGQVIFTFENGAGSVARAPSPARNPKYNKLPRSLGRESKSGRAAGANAISTRPRRAAHYQHANRGSHRIQLPELGENISQAISSGS